MLEKVKMTLRISHSALDEEINDLIEAARLDLNLSGVSSLKVNDDADPLIIRAIITYVKANFGFDNPDSEKLNQAYTSLKIHLSLAGDYNAIS
jgi:uncharacterized phage protein (predicted DNA packaging)